MVSMHVATSSTPSQLSEPAQDMDAAGDHGSVLQRHVEASGSCPLHQSPAACRAMSRYTASYPIAAAAAKRRCQIRLHGQQLDLHSCTL